MSHYTSTNDESFLGRITFDFVAQLENKLATSGMTQAELAKKLDVTESAVSQTLNLERVNPKLETMVRYARALGMKIAVVAYDDGDPNNENGPVGSDIFSLAWEKIGKPRDVWSVNENIQTVASNYARQFVFLPNWRPGWMNSTFEYLADRPNTAGRLLAFTVTPTDTQKGSVVYAGS